MGGGPKSARERAEIAFGALQTRELFRDRLAAEEDATAAARREKTARLKAARLAAEEAEPAAPAKPKRRSK